MLNNFKQFNENNNIQLVNFHDLEKDWNADRIVNAENGIYPYIVKDDKWVQIETYTSSQHSKVLFIKPEIAEELNKKKDLFQAAKNDYYSFIEQHKSPLVPYSLY